MQLTIHRGAKTIGANCVEIRTDSTRIMVDLGIPLFDDARQPFDHRLIENTNAKVLLEKGILPQIPGLFDDGSAVDGKQKIDAILLSHAHMDHTGFLQFTRPEIPVYATSGTSKMMSAGSIFARQVEIPRKRHRTLVPSKTVKIGDLTITTFAVDHSSYSSAAFLIEGDGKSILYTGDFRLHGRKPGMIQTMLDALKDKTIDLLVIEGTHVKDDASEEPETITEYELEEQIQKQVHHAPGLVLASFSPQHVDRLVCFLKAAQRTGRTFVVDIYTAYIMHLIKSEIDIPAPETNQGIRVYYPEYFLAGYERKNLTRIYDMFINDRIEMDEILSAPKNHLMIFRDSMRDSDFDGQFPEKTLAIFSRWEGYLESPESQKTIASLEATGGHLVHAHTSGHIVASDLAAFIKKINPKCLTPIHTFEPERFTTLSDNSRLLKDGETFEV